MSSANNEARMPRLLRGEEVQSVSCETHLPLHKLSE